MINGKYILFTRIPFIIDHQGRMFCDELWAKDLKEHLVYIKQFGICCPVVEREDTSGLEEISSLNIDQLFKLNKDYGWVSVFKNLLPNFLTVTKACRNAKFVHSSGAGWAFPLSFYILFLKPFLSFKWIMVIESSFWMLEQHEKSTFRKFVTHHLFTKLLRLCVKKADAKIFTQSFYRQYFLGDETKNTLIAPASWVDRNYLCTQEEVIRRVQLRESKKLKVIYPTRLIEEKGVYLVLEAIKILSKKSIPIHITIIGEGTLAEICQLFSEHDYGQVTVEYKKPVKYGQDFYNVLAEYDYTLVANIKQEQPRIIFDSFSQGVGVIASDTMGNQDITTENNAILFKTGDAQDLANTLASLIEKSKDPHPTALSYGLEGLAYANTKTHRGMHEVRQKFLENLFRGM